jgi:hypothetical protein
MKLSKTCGSSTGFGINPGPLGVTAIETLMFQWLNHKDYYACDIKNSAFRLNNIFIFSVKSQNKEPLFPKQH